MNTPAALEGISGSGSARSRLLTVVSAALAVAMALFAAAPAAQSASAPEDFLESYGDRAIAVLGDDSQSEAQRREAFRDLLAEGFDLESISAFVLTSYWRQASEAQRSNFIAAFQSVLAARFLPLFNGAKSDSFAIENTRSISGRDDLFSVETVLVGNQGRRVRTSWRIKKVDGNFQILDVAVEGASMAHTFRDEYRAFVRRSDQGLDGLIQQLQKQASG